MKNIVISPKCLVRRLLLGHSRRVAPILAFAAAFVAAPVGGHSTSALAQDARMPAAFEAPAVIELFTSQGCSSCPPADRLLAELARKPNIVALSLPVDYWDYLGWKDSLAQPAFTARQKAYAAARGDGHVYTPQVIVDGLHHGVGSDRRAIIALAKKSLGKNGAMKVAMRSSVAGGKVICELGDATAKSARKAGLWLYRVAKSREVKIGRGENTGRTVRYVNVVRSIAFISDWDGTAKRVEIDAGTLKQGDADGWILLLQSGTKDRPGAILAATKAEGF
jgi:hypothetical protein